MVAPLREFVRASGVTDKARGSAIPLTRLGWTPQHASWVGEIWRAIDSALELVLPDKVKSVCVFSDASDVGCAYVIVQCLPSEMTKPPHERRYDILHVWSRAWSGPERHWTVGEWELYPLHHAVTQNDWVLLGRSVSCYVDHQNLIPILRQPGILRKKQSVSRVTRRILDMPANLSVHHIPGVSNVMCDLLSRQFVPLERTSTPLEKDTEKADVKLLGASTTASVNVTLPHFIDVGDELFAMPSLDMVREYMSAGAAAMEAAELGAELRDPDLYYVGSRLFVPRPLRSAFIAGAHCGLGGHRGVVGTLANLSSVYWHDMEKDVAAEIAACTWCLRAAGPLQKRPWGRGLPSKNVNDLWSVDYFSVPGGYIALWREAVSQYAFATPHTNADALSACDSLEQLISTLGVKPKLVESDGGPHFKGEFADLLERLRIDHHIHHPRNPQANGSIENLGKQLTTTMLKLLAERRLESSKWRKVLRWAVFAMNNAPSALLLGRAPVEVFTGRSRIDLSAIATSAGLESAVGAEFTVGDLETMALSLREAYLSLEAQVVEHKTEVKDRRHEARARQRGVSQVDFAVDDLVLMSTEASVEGVGDKLMARWVGPFEVVALEGPLVARIRQLGSDREIVAHAQRLRRYDGPELKAKHEADLIKIADLSLRGRYLVDHIVDIIREGNAGTTFKVRVRWLGYEPEDDTLEPLPRIHADVPEILEEFLARKDLPDHIVALLPDIRAALNRRVTRGAAAEPRRFARLS